MKINKNNVTRKQDGGLYEVNTKQKSKEFTSIHNPSHYCEGRKYEPKDVIRDWGLNFNLGNVIKYISRNGRKEGETSIKDLRKAKTYLEFEIEALEKEGNKYDK